MCILEKISSYIRRLSDLLFNMSMIIIMPIFCCIITTDVTLRYLFNSPIPGSGEITGILLLLIFFSSITKCENENTNIQMELFYSKFSHKHKLFVNVFSKINALFLFLLLSYKSFIMVPDMIITNETGIDFILPLWPYRLFMAILSLLCSICITVDLLTNIKILFSGDQNG